MSTLWTLMRTVGPTDRPVSLTEAKASLRLSQSDTTHDLELASAIDAATEQLESDTDRAVMDQTFIYSAFGFPASGQSLPLPNQPTPSVTSVTYFDKDYSRQTLDPSVYGLDAGRRELFLNPDQAWPDHARHQDCLQVTYQCGYSDAAAVPKLMKRAILLQTGKWFRDPMMESNDLMNRDAAYETIIARLLRTSYP